jgi:hypothetical protein
MSSRNLCWSFTVVLKEAVPHVQGPVDRIMLEWLGLYLCYSSGENM